MSTLECPRCQSSLTRLVQNQLSFHRCKGCLGSLFSFYSMQKIVPLQVMNSMVAEAEKGFQNPHMICPCCRKNMKTICYLNTVDHNEYEIDVCTRCRVFWFDQNEISLPRLERKTLSAEADSALSDFNIEHERKLKQYDKIVDLADNLKVAPLGLPVGRVRYVGGAKLLLSLVGFPVELDQDVFKSPPIFTWSFIVLIMIVSLLGLEFKGYAESLAFYGNSTQLWQWFMNGVTYIFVHSDLLHLIGNLIFLWIFGDNVEDEIGRLNYVFLILISALASSWSFGFFSHSVDLPLVGVSGVVSALMAFYLLRFPYRQFVMRFFYFLFPVPGIALLILFFVKDFLGVLLQMSNQSHISYISHFAGLVVGGVFFLWWRQRQKNGVSH